MIRVFLLDDHEMVRQGLRALLETESDISVVGDAASAEQCLARLPSLKPDIAIIDVFLPDGDGIEVCREIRSRLPTTACLILTAFPAQEALLAAAIAGATGYIAKQAGGDDLVDAIRRVHRGDVLITASQKAEAIRLAEEPRDPLLKSLTKRERITLDLIAEGLTNRQIAAKMSVGEATIRNYVSRVLGKLGMQHRTQAAIYAARLADQAGEGTRAQRPFGHGGSPRLDV